MASSSCMLVVQINCGLTHIPPRAEYSDRLVCSLWKTLRLWTALKTEFADFWRAHILLNIIDQS
ncbi:MAG: hypothetical protein U5P10_00745 [Spirochaetia bacterium]|nr:hypothetical protein [Spirochaetia bacterium]